MKSFNLKNKKKIALVLIVILTQLNIDTKAQDNEVFVQLGHSSGIQSVAFSPDGRRMVSGSWDENLKIWDAESFRELHTLQGHNRSVNSVAFSPDGRQIVSGSDDETLKVWDAESGHELRTLQGHTSVVFSVAYSPDGRRIVSGSADKTLKVWVNLQQKSGDTNKFY